MRKIKNPILAQLLMETSFIPRRQQIIQIAAAEKLYKIAKPNREYPFEFVCFRITGYRPKGANKELVLKGTDLIESLPRFILRASGRIKLRADEEKQKVYSINSLAKKLNVSGRTAERWRKKGLIGRKYIFADGTVRTGFSETIVKEFIKANSQLVEKAGRFSKIPRAFKQKIIEQIITAAEDESLSRQQVIKKIAKQTNRATETIRCILVDYEKHNAKRSLFKKPHIVIKTRERAIIFNMFEAGMSIDELAEKFCRNKSSIYRIISKRRVRKLQIQKIEYIKSDEFAEDNAEEKILGRNLSLPGILRRKKIPLDSKDAQALPRYFDIIKNVPTLNRQQESQLFKRYNFLKYLANNLKTKLKLASPCGKDIRKAEAFLAEAEQVKNIIIEANLKLVVRIATRHSGRANLADLVSEGNIALMRAVEGFDYTRGFRFGTYASWVITKDFARHIPAEAERIEKAGSDRLFDGGRQIKRFDSADIEAIESAHHSLEEVITDNLTERQQYIIRYHFGLIGTMVKKKSKTLKQIGEELNLSKERVRQIELVALQKLRQSLSDKEFELLTG